MRPIRIAVLASGNGSNLQALIDAQVQGGFNGEIGLVFSNRKKAYALERARQAGIEALHLSIKDFESAEAFDAALLDLLKARAIDLIVEAGYLRILSSIVCDAYAKRIINIHPALLPAFGGDGFYGMHVHQAVYDSGVKYSGATVHFVTETIDGGPIILQHAIPLDQDWQPEDIQAAVLKIEHPLVVQAVKLYCDNKLEIIENRVYIRGE